MSRNVLTEWNSSLTFVEISLPFQVKFHLHLRNCFTYHLSTHSFWSSSVYRVAWNRNFLFFFRASQLLKALTKSNFRWNEKHHLLSTETLNIFKYFLEICSLLQIEIRKSKKNFIPFIYSWMFAQFHKDKKNVA